MMMSTQEQERLSLENGGDWIKTAAATLVFLLQQIDQNTPVFKIWGFFTLRVSHLVRGITAVFGPFNT